MSSQEPKTNLIYCLVAVGFTVMFFSTCIKSVYQVYFSDLAVHFGRGRSDFAWSGALFMLITGLMSPVVGSLSDRYGPLRVVALGCASAGIALVSVSIFNNSLAVFVLAYGLLASFGLSAMTYVPMGVLVDRLFEKKKTGLAYAIVTNGTSISFIVLSPFWLWLVPHAKWEDAFLTTGLFILAPLTAVAWIAAAKANAAGYGGRARETQGNGSAWSTVKKDAGFYALAVGFFGCGASMAFIDVHLVAFWQDGSTPRMLMGWSLSLLGMLELLSGLLTGWLAIRWSKRKLLASFYLLRSCSIFLLISSVQELRTLGFAGLFGATYLGTVVLTSMFCLERYGVKIKGQIFGMLFFAHQLGAFAAVQLGAVSFDIWGSYEPFITVLAALVILGGITSWFFLQDPAMVSHRKP